MHDVFISYSSHDKASADAACQRLEAANIRCWIAPRDIAPAAAWSAQITQAIRASKVFILLFTHNSNASQDVLNEVALAAERHLHIVNFRLEATTPSDALHYHLRSRHWLDALTPPVAQHLDRLVAATKQLLALDPQESSPAEAPPPPVPVPVSSKVISVAKKFDYWMKNYEHHDDTHADSFKVFVTADKCLAEYGVTYEEYIRLAEHLKTMDYVIEWVVPKDTFDFLIADSRQRIATAHQR